MPSPTSNQPAAGSGPRPRGLIKRTWSRLNGWQRLIAAIVGIAIVLAVVLAVGIRSSRPDAYSVSAGESAASGMLHVPDDYGYASPSDIARADNLSSLCEQRFRHDLETQNSESIPGDPEPALHKQDYITACVNYVKTNANDPAFNMPPNTPSLPAKPDSSPAAMPGSQSSGGDGGPYQGDSVSQVVQNLSKVICGESDDEVLAPDNVVAPIDFHATQTLQCDSAVGVPDAGHGTVYIFSGGIQALPTAEQEAIMPKADSCPLGGTDVSGSLQATSASTAGPDVIDWLVVGMKQLHYDGAVDVADAVSSLKKDWNGSVLCPTAQETLGGDVQ